MEQHANKFRFKVWLALSVAGLIGVASMLLWEMPPDLLPAEARALVSPEALRWLVLVNPAVLVLLSTTIGTLLYHRVGLSAPVTERLLYKSALTPVPLKMILWRGILFGVAAGLVIVGVAAIFEPHLPVALTGRTQLMELPMPTRLLYGGITEEILLRFGLMTLLVWVFRKISGRLNPAVFGTAILITSVIFAIAHLPAVLQVVPEPGPMIYGYVITGNTLGGLLFGYAYWKKGIECAILAHAMTHVTMASAAMVSGG